jgi:hypothetical protein
VGLLVLLALILWWIPVAGVFPLHFSPDTNLHMGWATQLMNGESSPSAVVTGDVPNYYPWLYHSLVALLASFTRGQSAFLALNPLQVLFVVGMVLALVALGRQLTGRMSGGVAAAFFGALSGGFGIGLLFDPNLVERIPDLPAIRVPFLGEVLSRRPYNFGFNNLAPPYPRDLSFLLLVVVLLLLVVGLQRKSRAGLVGSGIALGLAGLAGGEAFIVASGTVFVACMVTLEKGRFKQLGYVALAAMGVYAVWLVPMTLTYLRLDGFVNTTHVGAVVLEPAFFILSWGISVPFAIVGAARMIPRFLDSAAARVPLALLLSAGGLMLSDAVPAFFGNAFLTLGRDHRYWSLFHLGVALVAAVGTSYLWEKSRDWRPLASSGAAIAVILGCAAPLYASLNYTRAYPPAEHIRDTLRGEDTILNAIAPSPGRRCVASVPGNRLARETFAYTGYRLVLWVSGQTVQNWARIRWAELAGSVSSDRERLRDNTTLTQGLGDQEWSTLAEKYDVNYVMVPSRFAASPAFDGLDKETFTRGNQSITLVRVAPCS